MTLVEGVVSLALVAVIVVSLTSALSQSSVFSKRMDLLYTATYLAEKRIDTLKRLEFGNLYPAAVESNVRVGSDGAIDPDGDYVRTTELVESYGDNTRLIKVKVSVDKVRIRMDGSKDVNPVTGRAITMGEPVVMETLFVNTSAE